MSLLLKKLVTPLVMLAWATYYFIQVSGQNPQSQYLIRPVYFAIVGIFVVIAYNEYKQIHRDSVSNAKPVMDLQAVWGELKNNHVAIFIAGTGLYLLLMPYLGYILATVVYLFAGFTVLRVHRHTAVILAPALAAAVYVVFKVLLSVPLPTGLFGI